MLFPRSHAWTPRQKWLLTTIVCLALVTVGTLVYVYERYHRGPSESALFGTWEATSYAAGAPIYYQFRSDHAVLISWSAAMDERSLIDTGKWYAGGPNIYLRFDPQYPGRPEIWHIVDIAPGEIRVRQGSADRVDIFKRVDPVATRASNQTMQRTATRFVTTFSTINTLPFRLALAPGSRR